MTETHPQNRLLGYALASAIRNGLTEGITITLPRKLYEEEYRAPPVPRGMRLDSQFGVAFRVCMHRLVNLLTADTKTHKLNIVVEDGHSNVKTQSEFLMNSKQKPLPLVCTFSEQSPLQRKPNVGNL